MQARVIVYSSRAQPGLGRAEIAEILASARRRNAEHGISGMLLSGPSMFLQLLEGPVTAVDETFRRICMDSRHTEVRLCYDGRDEPRRFVDWAMGYARMEDLTHLGTARALLHGAESEMATPRASMRVMALLMEVRRAQAHAWAGAPQAA